MNPNLDVSVTMISAALQLRALGEWLMVNHERLDPAIILFLGCYMSEVARRAGTVMTVITAPQRQVIAGRRCIFY